MNLDYESFVDCLIKSGYKKDKLVSDTRNLGNGQRYGRN